MKRFLTLKHCMLVSAIAAFGLTALSTLLLKEEARAQTRSPILQDGSRSLYKRILTRPNAILRESAGEAASELRTLSAFLPFYIFKEEGNWIQVGSAVRGGPEGWLKTDQTVPWKQAIVAAFTNPAGRERTLMFRSRDAMLNAISGEDVVAEISALRERAVAGVLSANAPVVAIEPDSHINIEEQFYILPILAWQKKRLPTTNRRAKLLEVATLSKKTPQPRRSREEILRDYKIGITFVIDTTRSMKPYIDQTREAVRKMQQRIAGSEEGERVRFGLIGFRDNTSLVPGLDYVAKNFLPLSVDSTAEKFVETIGRLDVATSNSTGFNEDSVAGVMAAIEENDWGPFGGRYIVLVTDAGPREPGELAKRGTLATAQLSQLAKEKNIALYTLHLKTNQGEFDHEYAANEYKKLSRFGNSLNLYYGVEGGNPASFRSAVDSLTGSLTEQFYNTLNGEFSRLQLDGTNDIEGATSSVGRAMQLAYLGREEGTAAPDVFRAWVSDRDPLDTAARPVEPRILMNKNRLTTLVEVMEEIVRQGNSTFEQANSSEFFAQLQSAMARMAQQQGQENTIQTLGDALGDYLKDLPYDSDVTGMTQRDWQRLPAAREREFLNALESKLSALRLINNDPDRWVNLFNGAGSGESVTTIPLDMLP